MKLLNIGVIPKEARGVLYTCRFDREKNELEPFGYGVFGSIGNALEAYANIPNPESQLVTGKTYEELIVNLKKLHKNMQDPEWVKKLKDYL